MSGRGYLHRIAAGIARRARAHLRRIAGGPAPYQFLPGPSIEHQAIRFRFGGRAFVAEAGHDTPLYETIAEVVDYDSYQLRELPAAELADTTLVDIGANVGVTTLCLATLTRGTVLSFEPAPGNLAWLEANVKAGDCSNVSVVPCAITDRTGVASLWVPDHEGVGSRVVPGDSASNEPLVPIKTLDLATALGRTSGPIGLIKIDCEGGEYAIVEQLTADIVARVRNITFEVHDRGHAHNVGTLSARLRLLGYRLRPKPDPFGREGLHHLLASR